MSYKYQGSRNSGAPSWFLQRVTGIILVVVMVSHYILMHYSLDSGHTFAAVMERMKEPFWKMFDLTFITLGLYHGLNGTWNVFRDYKSRPAVSLTLYGIILVAGIAFWVLGVNTILSF